MSRPFGNRKRRHRKAQPIRANTYGGKIHGCSLADEWAYETSRGWFDAFESNEFWGDNAALLTGPFRLAAGERVADWRGPILNRAERRSIRQHAGAIVYESSDGFVSVDWYDSATALTKQWERIEAHYNPADDDSDDDSESDD